MRLRRAVLGAVLFACVPAEPAVAAPLYFVEGGLVLDATGSVDPARSELHPFVALRGGGLFSLSDDGELLLGGDARLLIEAIPRVRGTADVGSLAWEIGLEPRGLVGWRFGDGPLQLVPYAFGGVVVGARVLDLYTFGDHQLRSHALYGARAGVGGLVRAGRVTLSLELGGGLREDGPEVLGALLAGASF